MRYMNKKRTYYLVDSKYSFNNFSSSSATLIPSSIGILVDGDYCLSIPIPDIKEFKVIKE